MSLALSLDHSWSDFQLKVDFSIQDHGVTVLFGPSGCGKTSILRAIAGLERFNGASVRFGGAVWQGSKAFVPSHKRAIGYVFQEARLFDHLSVRDNLLYGQKRSRSQRRTDSKEVIDLLGVGDLLERSSVHLSGGEKQRVAIGRALLSEPDILLMDEPLSALDEENKQAILPYLERLSQQLSVPIIYVTHDRREVERLADQVVLLDQGRVTAQGTVHDVFNDAGSPFAQTVQARSLWQVPIAAHDDADDLTALDLGQGQCLWVPRLAKPVGASVRVVLAAKDVSLSMQRPEGSSLLNILPARVIGLEGDTQSPVRVQARLQTGQPIFALITKRSRRQLALQVGDELYVQIKSVSLLDDVK